MIWAHIGHDRAHKHPGRCLSKDAASEPTVFGDDAQPKTTAEIFPRIRHVHPHAPADDRTRLHTSALGKVSLITRLPQVRGTIGQA